MITIDRLSKRYGKRVALANVSLKLNPGEVTLLLGANGAGKSTLLRCLLGLTDFDGSIRVDGLNPLTDGRAVRARVGYMPQTGGLHRDLTVAQTMALYADIRRVPRDRGARLLDEAGLGAEHGTLVGDLSGGMRQRLGFALALLTDPPILVLDEPSSSLDAASRLWLAQRLRSVAREGRTVLVSTHAGQELFDAGDRRVLLEDGATPEINGVADVSTSGVATPGVGHVTGTARPLMLKELRDALGNRWLIGYAALMGVLGVAATAAGLDGASGLALQGFGRTTATLMNLCLLLAPLVAVLMGAASIAGERDRGTLEHLLAQPLSRTQLLLGKHAGLLLAIAGATVAGFVPAGVLIAGSVGLDVIPTYVIFPTLATLAAAAMTGVGVLISISSRSAVQAQGAAVFAWFAFALLYDLVVIGALAGSGVSAPWLAATLLANPIDAARVLGVLALEPDLYMLGPAGAYLSTALSPAVAAVLLCAAVLLWATAPVAAAVVWFSSSVKRRSRNETKRVSAAGGRLRTRGRDRVHVGDGVPGI
jgi:ABC-type multidrug transport system ATPase subunit/ABC-type transport system involved in multi-copper enzyme maturation permease subunit